MHTPTLSIVHGFAVVSPVFGPLRKRLRLGSIDASLFRYPSVGLSLTEITERVAGHLHEHRPDAIVAHSIGCFATWLAVQEIGWKGPIVLLAPPLTTIPSTRLIPKTLRWPFAPLIDHRTMTSEHGFRLMPLAGCQVLTIAGRFDYSVPESCTHHEDIDQCRRVFHTHNSLIMSPKVASACAKWVIQALPRG